VRIGDLPVPGSHSITVGGSNPALAGLSSGPRQSVVSGPPQPALENVALPGEPKIDLGTVGGATAALDYIDGKVDAILDIRSQLGATQNTLAAAYDNTAIGASNLSAARSRIRDTDYASEAAQLTRAQILRQAGASMVAQANALPQQALLLLR
jgi:flagellin